MKSIIKKFKNNLQQESLKCTPQRLSILEEMIDDQQMDVFIAALRGELI